MPNDQEVLRITGCDDLFDAVEHVRSQGVSVVALKLGAGGARLRHDGGIDECVVVPATGGDTVGAGDSFDAGFLAGWLRGMPLQTCLEIACACGRGVASAVGGVRGQPRWDDEVIRRIRGRADHEWTD
jgi:sugar/nucleoside kinase (ribokinase family)